MYKKFEELEIGSEFFQWRGYAGPVKFEIIDEEHDIFKIKSTSTNGFDFELDKRTFHEMVKDEKYCFHKTLPGILKHRKKLMKIKEDEYFNKFAEDKDLFIEEMFCVAYTGNSGYDHSNSPEATALKRLFKHHFPDLKIKEN